MKSSITAQDFLFQFINKSIKIRPIEATNIMFGLQEQAKSSSKN